MLDGQLLIDAHVHVPVLGSLAPAWIQWARDFGPDGILEDLWDTDGRPRPARLDELFEEQGVDAALLFCEYSPKATGYQLFDDLLPIVEHNPRRFRPVANVNPHLHFPIADEVRRQLDHGAAALKLHPVHGGFRCDDPALYPAYQVLAERGVPLVVHCGTSTFPGSMNELAHPELPAAGAPRLPRRRRRPGSRRPWLVVRRRGVHGAEQPARVDRALRSASQAAARVLRALRPRPARRPLDLRHRLARRTRAPRRTRARSSAWASTTPWPPVSWAATPWACTPASTTSATAPTRAVPRRQRENRDDGTEGHPGSTRRRAQRRGARAAGQERPRHPQLGLPQRHRGAVRHAHDADAGSSSRSTSAVTPSAPGRAPVALRTGSPVPSPTTRSWPCSRASPRRRRAACTSSRCTRRRERWVSTLLRSPSSTRATRSCS